LCHKEKREEFCCDRTNTKTWEKWSRSRQFGKLVDSFKSCQGLERDREFILEHDAEQFIHDEYDIELMLKQMPEQFNAVCSISHYCIAVTVMTKNENE
jgi:hypothetical protein